MDNYVNIIISKLKEMIKIRLLHPKTIEIIAKEKVDYSKSSTSQKRALAHVWSEVIKFKSQTKSHPKMFILDDFDLGVYMRYIYSMNEQYNVGCKLNADLLNKFDEDMMAGFLSCATSRLNKYFDDLYLFSDCVSLYYKGCNIMPFVYKDNWRRLVPVESLKEIQRQIGKVVD